MSEFADSVDSEGRTGTFDGVCRAEDRVQQLVVVGRAFELKKRSLHVFDVLGGLIEERLQKLTHVDLHTSSSVQLDSTNSVWRMLFFERASIDRARTLQA